jgi:hypothetical protein
MPSGDRYLALRKTNGFVSPFVETLAVCVCVCVFVRVCARARACSRVAACVRRNHANSKARVAHFKLVGTKIPNSSEMFTPVVEVSGSLLGSLRGYT